MEYRKIGSLNVSEIGLGTNSFGGRLPAEETAAVLHAAIDAGVNFIDTADTYTKTRSETCIGNALGALREKVVLATKFGIAFDDAHPGGADKEYVRFSVEGSLRRLATDHIDLVIVHRPDPKTPISETLEALHQLILEGKIREIGYSKASVEQLEEAQAAADSLGITPFTNLQNEFSLLHREPESGMLAKCEELGVGFVPYFPLASGVLTGKYQRNKPAPEGSRLAGMDESRRSLFLNDHNFDIIESLTSFAQERGHTLLELAFCWLLAHPQVSSVIAGATKPSQIEGNVATVGWRLTDSEFAEVNQLLDAS